MVRRTATVSLVLVMLMMCIAPLCIQDDSDAITEEDVKVSVPGFIEAGDGRIHTFIGNGCSKTVMIYVQNKTDHMLDVAFYGMSDNSHITGETVLNMTLMPVGDPEGRDVEKRPYTISVAEVTPSYKDVHFSIDLFVTDLVDDSYIVLPVKFVFEVVSSFDTSSSYNRFFGVIDNTLPEPFNTPLVPFSVTLLTFILVAFVVIKILVPVISAFLSEEIPGEERRRLRALLTFGVLTISIALFIDPGLRILGADLDSIFLINKIATTILIIVLSVTIWKIYMIVCEGILRRLGRAEGSKIDLTLLPIFAMIGKLILWLLGTASILHVFGFDLSGILISAGIVTLGITLGAQSVLSQFFSGLVLLLTRPFSRGDYLLINDVTYVVKKVGLMYTEFMGDEFDRVTTMPNNTVAAATIVNMSKYDRAYRLYIFFQVPYSIDLKKAEEVMLQIAEESKYVLHDYSKYKKPVVKLIDFKDAGVELRLDVTIVDFAKKPTIQSDLKKELYVKLAESGIEVPYNRLEVVLMGDEADGPAA